MMNQRIRRLAGLARIRGFEEDRAAAALAARTRTRDEAQHAHMHAERRLENSGFPPEMDTVTFRAVVAARAAATSAFTSALLTFKDAEAARETAREQWRHARTRTRIAQKLVDKQRSQEEHEQLAREQKAIDEIAARMRTTQGGRAQERKGRDEWQTA
ncbi:MAG: flagellar export protein FliJ [Ancrocorticia sp.]|jgi:flagellar export protein FliJ|nr:flagellar export protein FliJ [Ancrocorticia sp.]MCI2178347.1 flagellar export protein FliJ [Ancrocorticia sp.]MCI2193153.1 flagellar export protein FliJ [Ancrocorticia sp.]MCI2198847.1 flagellar export protein FliJ [Ancrocorticia sp.]